MGLTQPFHVQVLIEELQRSVETISKENAALRKEADALREKVEDLSRENFQLLLQQLQTKLTQPNMGSSTFDGASSSQMNSPPLGLGQVSSTTGPPILAQFDHHFRNDGVNPAIPPLLGPARISLLSQNPGLPNQLDPILASGKADELFRLLVSNTTHRPF
jgi:hypothetical protein